MENRRQFIKKLSLFSTGSVYVLSGCSTMDEYLITNPSDLTDHVIIVGGGITGLYAAYQLKKRKISYRLFESTHRLGGQILSDHGFEYGAFEFSSLDNNLLALAKDLNLKIEKTDSKSWIFKNGTAEFIEHLTDRISGVLPNQQIKLNHKLLSVNSNSNSKDFRLTFATEKSDKTYSAKNVLFALPAKQLIQIKGLDSEIKDLKNQFLMYKHVRIVIPQKKLGLKFGSIKNKSFDKFNVTCDVKTIKGLIYVTLSGNEAIPNFPHEIELIHIWLAENVFEIPATAFTTDSDQIYVWQTASLPESINLSAKAEHRIVSDGFNVSEQRVENLLVAVNQQIDQFL